MINTIEMSLRNISPHVRFLNLLQCAPTFDAGPRMLYDHQFLYIHKGHGQVIIKDVVYQAKAGDLFYYGPTVPHTFSAEPSDPFLLTGFHFDFTQTFKDIRVYPIGSLVPSLFDYNLVTEEVCFTDFVGFPVYMNIRTDSRIRELLLDMADEYEKERIFFNNCINGLFLKWIFIVARHVIALQEGMEGRDIVLSQIVQFIQSHYYENLTNEELGEIFHFHPNYLNQMMLIHTGMTIHQYVIQLRIKRALNLILNTDKSICDISLEVGYEDIHYFSRLFKRKTGYTPSIIKDRTFFLKKT